MVGSGGEKRSMARVRKPVWKPEARNWVLD